MASNLKPQQIIIPTGYEGLQQKAASKRRLADVMLQSGMGMAQNPQHIAQVLGALAQQWVSKDAGKQADKFELEAGQRMGEDYQRKFGEFQTDARTMQPDQVVAKWGADPMAGDWLKPYASTMEAGMKEGQQLGYHDGMTWGRKGDMQIGSAKPNDPNAGVVRDQSGNWIINPVATTAAIARQGIPIEQGTMSMSDPAMGGQVPGMPQVAAGSEIPALSMDQVNAAMGALGPAGTVSWLQKNKIKVKVTTPEQAKMLPPGTVIITPDGQERVVN